MGKSRISSEGIQPGNQQAGKVGELVNNEADISANNSMEKCDLEMDNVPSGPVNGCQVHNLPLDGEGKFTSKRQKVNETEEVNSTRLKATESSVVEWLKNLDEGASLIDILKHFNESNEDSVNC